MTNTNERRLALVVGDRETIAKYLPGNYEVVDANVPEDRVLVVGRDHAGWTLDDYVLPRLASGLIFGEEIAPVPDWVWALIDTILNRDEDPRILGNEEHHGLLVSRGQGAIYYIEPGDTVLWRDPETDLTKRITVEAFLVDETRADRIGEGIWVRDADGLDYWLGGRDETLTVRRKR